MTKINRTGRLRLFTSRNWILLAPSLALAFFLVAILSVLLVLYWHDRETQNQTALRDVQWVEDALRREISSNQDFVDRLARQIADAGDVPAGVRAEASEFLQDSPVLLNLVWNAPDGEMRWLASSGRTVSQTIQERPAALELERMLRLTQAMSRATYTHAYRDFARNAYIEYHAPMTHAGRFVGTLSATYSLAGIIESVIPAPYTQKYQFSFRDAAGDLLVSQVPLATLNEMFSQSVTLTLPWRDIRLTATSYRQPTPLIHKVLGGLTVALLAVLAWAFWLMQRMSRRRIESDEALARSHERFMTVLDALDAAVYVADLDSRQVLFMNETCRQRFPAGRLNGDVALLERVFGDTPTERFASEALVTEDGPGGSVLKDEFEDRHTGRWYVVRAKGIRWVDGRVVRMHMAADITDRKEAEEATRLQKDKLMQTARLLTAGEMASTLAHEINQPLAAIANYNMGCVRRLKSGHWKAEDLISAMEKASQQAERAGQVVQRVREFVRTREPNRRPIDLNQLVADVARLIEVDAEQSNTRLTLELAAPPPRVMADRIMIEQVLLNLLRNAIEAMAETPPEMRRVIVRTQVDDEQVHLSVSDRGRGIDPAQEPDLFSPFFTTKAEGMGIGLNICRSIVELHEGHLWFTRNAERGSTFHFSLAVATSATAQTESLR